MKMQELSTLEQSFMTFDTFLKEKRKELPFKLSQMSSDKDKMLLIEEFFDQVEKEKNKVIENLAYSQLKQKSPGKKSRKSPTKSPNKKPRKATDENASPTKNSETSYISPTSKRPPASSESPPTRDNGDLSHYLQLPDGSAPQESQKASCKVSPLKRMKKLEDQENLENQENIEQTYHNSPENRANTDATTNDADSSEENPQQLSETHDMKPMFEGESKSLLQAKESF